MWGVGIGLGLGVRARVSVGAGLVGFQLTVLMALITSMPSVILPKTGCFEGVLVSNLVRVRVRVRVGVGVRVRVRVRVRVGGGAGVEPG